MFLFTKLFQFHVKESNTHRKMLFVLQASKVSPTFSYELWFGTYPISLPPPNIIYIYINKYYYPSQPSQTLMKELFTYPHMYIYIYTYIYNYIYIYHLTYPHIYVYTYVIQTMFFFAFLTSFAFWPLQATSPDQRRFSVFWCLDQTSSAGPLFSDLQSAEFF